VLKGYGHYHVYVGEALRQVMDASISWCQLHLPVKQTRAALTRNA
jgi:hypothetical protein